MTEANRVCSTDTVISYQCLTSLFLIIFPIATLYIWDKNKCRMHAMGYILAVKRDAEDNDSGQPALG